MNSRLLPLIGLVASGFAVLANAGGVQRIGHTTLLVVLATPAITK